MSEVAIVTGGAGVLGTQIARRLHDAGHALLLVDLDERVHASAESLGAAEACVANLTSDDGVAAVLEALGPRSVSVLVNSAGITRDARLSDMDLERFGSVIDVNLLGAMRLTLALEDRLADGAAVVNMSSRAALGNPGQVNYSASKSGLVSFTRAMAQRLAPRARANALAPSLIDSPMVASMPQHVVEKLVAKIPAGRVGTPDEVADAVAYLASSDASYVNGQVLLLCGGRSVAP